MESESTKLIRVSKQDHFIVKAASLNSGYTMKKVLHIIIKLIPTEFNELAHTDNKIDEPQKDL